jgi:lipopolysaccharide/colanic/teichoic acid biosynthesis glycosyltransferase
MKKKEKLLKICLLFGDFLLMYVALFLSLVLRNKGLNFDFINFAYSFSVLYILWLPFIYALDFYEINYFKKTSFLYNLIVFCFISCFLGLAYFYLRPQLTFTPKTILILNIVIFVIVFYVWRKIFDKVIVKNFKEKIVFVGDFENLPAIAMALQAGNFEVLPLTTKEKIEYVVLGKNAFFPIFNKAKYLSYADFYEILNKKVSLDNFSEATFLEKMSNNENKTYFVLKRILDICLGLIFFLVTAVLFPFIALAIKVDSKGSIFYNQKRVGKGRKIFTVCKFRTMKETNNQYKEIWREKKENQITMVGEFLRRFHLDELPQCISILKGELSFVGPRPEWIEIDKIFEKEIPFYNYRYLENPGFTGWAQINFKPSVSVEEAKEKFEYDLYYMKNKSIVLDIEIVLKTLRLLIHKKI